NEGDLNRWSDVLEAVAKLAGWQPRVAASSLSSANVVRGRGIALGGFAGSQAAVVAEIEVNRKTGKITAKELWAAEVAGLAVHLEGLDSQMVGCLSQGVSRALFESVSFDTKRVTSLDW